MFFESFYARLDYWPRNCLAEQGLSVVHIV